MRWRLRLALGPILLKLNDAATVYVTPVSFEHLAEPAPLSPERFAALPVYAGAMPQQTAEYRRLQVSGQ